ncbi:MAG TPA: hypothetical protein VMK66_01300 [Myxococcales bacterium]|nr:hypothetical protein [Myxococcales bacterium]
MGFFFWISSGRVGEPAGEAARSSVPEAARRSVPARARVAP